MKDSTATINYEDRHFKIKCANPQQLGTTVGVVGRLLGLSKEFNKVIDPAPTSVVDIGANVGSYSLMFHYCFPEAKILAIEPSTYNMPYIEYNCGHIPEIEIRQLAIGSKMGSGMLSVPSQEQKQLNNDYPDTHTGCLSLHGKSDNLQEEVDIFPLDELNIQRPIGLIKIDVEGHEIHVLDGASKIIEEDRPKLLVEIREDNLKMAGMKKWHLYRKLAGMGYFPRWKYGHDSMFYPVGIDYILDKLDYNFMEETKRGWAR